MNTINADATVTVPDGANYIRVSTYATYVDMVQVGQNVSRDAYKDYKYYTLHNLILSDEVVNKIIVDASGGGDYTSFTEAVYDNVDNGKPIIVKAMFPVRRLRNEYTRATAEVPSTS